MEALLLKPKNPYIINQVDPHPRGDWSESEVPKMPEVTYFPDTPYAITLPRGRNPQRWEFASLSIDQLKTEPFNLYLKHLLIFTRVETDTMAGRHLDTIIQRQNTDVEAFIREVYGVTESEGRIEAETNVWQFILNEATYKAILDGLRNPGSLATKESVSALYDASKKHPDFLGFSLILDARNKKRGEGIGIEMRVKEDTVPPLLSGEGVEDLEKRLHWISIASPDLLLGCLRQALVRSDSKEQTEQVVRRIAQYTGLERIRVSLREYLADNPLFRAKFDHVFAYIGLDSSSRIGADLQRDVYDQIEFSGYGPNEENLKFETSLLEKELGTAGEVIDIGCGTGRLLLPLSDNTNRHVVGIDQSQKHVDRVKAVRAGVDVRVGSWFTLPFADVTFDAAYCLGRSLTHNISIPDAIAGLAEMRRVIKDDGAVIVDLPDPTQGEYKNLIARTAKISQRRGIKVYLPGLINDSPDGQHYFDRLALDPEQFGALCQLAGFKAEVIATKPYKGSKGKENVNVYYRLKKGPAFEEYNDVARSTLFDRLHKGGRNIDSFRADLLWGGLAEVF